MGKPASGRNVILVSRCCLLLISCGGNIPRTEYPIAAAQTELQIDIRIAQSATNSSTLNVIVDRIAPRNPGKMICFDTITQVVSMNTPDQATDGDQPNYRVDVQAVSDPAGLLCISQTEQLPNNRLQIAQLAIDIESALSPYDRVQFLHSIVIAQAKPARQIRTHVVYHIDSAGRVVERLHASEAGPTSTPSLEVVEIILVRPLLYQILAPIILGALFTCALLMMLIHERTTFIQATIAMTVGTWNARQLLVPTDTQAHVLDQVLLCIYALIWVSFVIFTIRLKRRHPHS